MSTVKGGCHSEGAIANKNTCYAIYAPQSQCILTGIDNTFIWFSSVGPDGRSRGIEASSSACYSARSGRLSRTAIERRLGALTVAPAIGAAILPSPTYEDLWCTLDAVAEIDLDNERGRTGACDDADRSSPHQDIHLVRAGIENKRIDIHASVNARQVRQMSPHNREIRAVGVVEGQDAAFDDNSSISTNLEVGKEEGKVSSGHVGKYGCVFHTTGLYHHARYRT